MAAFVGKWKQDEFDVKNLTDFIKVTGLPEKAVENFKVRTILDIQQDGKKWTINLETIDEPILTKSYEFTPGEPFQSTDPFGRKFKSMTEVVSDTRMKETCTEWSQTAVDIIREIHGNKMTHTYICKGVQIHMTFSRI